MPKFSESDIETIKSRLRLSDVISSYVRLTRQGSTDDYKACCPFHNEKTPSFIVHNDKGFYHCFGCGKSGNMFTFVQEMEKLSFPEAVEELAKKAGIELKVQTKQEKEKYDRIKVVGDIYNRITNSFHQILLTHPGAQKARSYLENRNVDPKLVERFKLGYAPSDSTWLYKFLKKNNFSDEILWESGLIYKEYSNRCFFSDRILFPVRDLKGNTIAFSGRDLSGESKAKYKNSSDSPIYSKKDNLFGLYESLDDVKKNGILILCEGNFDVLALHQAGLTHAVAPLGTAFTDEQAKLIKRYCSKLYLLFDSDSAGENATRKAIMLCQKHDIECLVIRSLPNVKDASEMLEKYGAQALVNACLNTDTAFSYLVHLALKRYDIRQPKGKSSVFKEVKPYLDATSSQIERQAYIKQLSDVLKISEEQILKDYTSQRQELTEPVAPQTAHKTVYNPLKISVDLHVMLLLMNNRSYFETFRREIKINQLEDKAAQMLYAVLENACREEFRTDEVVLQMISDDDLRNFTASTFTDGIYSPSDVQRAVKDAVRQIRLQRLTEMRANVISLLNTAELSGPNAQEYRNMLEAKQDLDRRIEELKKNDTEVI